MTFYHEIPVLKTYLRVPKEIMKNLCNNQDKYLYILPETKLFLWCNWQEQKLTQVRKLTQEIIWLDPLFNQSVIINIAKTLLKLIDKYFPKVSSFCKLFKCDYFKVDSEAVAQRCPANLLKKEAPTNVFFCVWILQSF